MVDLEKLLSQMTLDQLTDFLSKGGPGSQDDQMARAEFMRRQTEMQIKAMYAALEAAGAVKATARYVRRNARYMLWSVIVLAASSFLGLVRQFL